MSGVTYCSSITLREPPCSRPPCSIHVLTYMYSTVQYSTNFDLTCYACSKYRAPAPGFRISSSHLRVFVFFPSSPLFFFQKQPPRAVCQAPGILAVTGIAACGPKNDAANLAPCSPFFFFGPPSSFYPPGFDNLQLLPSCYMQAFVPSPSYRERAKWPWVQVPLRDREHYWIHVSITRSRLAGGLSAEYCSSTK